MQKIIRGIGAVFAGMAITASLFFLAGAMPASAASSSSPAPADGTSDVRPLCRNIETGAPCGVASFTLHCQFRMATRDISEQEVQELVWAEAGNAYQQGNGNWRYNGSEFTVVLNDNASCVTVF